MRWKNVLYSLLPSENMYRKEVKAYRSWRYLLFMIILASTVFISIGWSGVMEDPLLGVVLGLTASILVFLLGVGLIATTWMLRKLAQRLEVKDTRRNGNA